jgi:hypothetical protein
MLRNVSTSPREPDALGAIAGFARNRTIEIMGMSEAEQDILKAYGAGSFEEAMKYDDNAQAFLREAEEMQKKLGRERFAEVLLIVAETNPLEFLYALSDPDFPDYQKLDAEATEKATVVARELVGKQGYTLDRMMKDENTDYGSN